MFGWEPAEVTTYEYDDRGVLVRSITVREPEFSVWDRAVLLADVEDEQVPRGRHGLPIAESTDPANQFAYVVGDPTMDWAQKALDEKQETYRKANPGVSLGALLWKVRRRD